MNRLKVLIIPSFYPDKFNTTHGIFFKEQAKQLAKFSDVSILNLKTIWLDRNFLKSLKQKRNIVDYFYSDSIHHYQETCFSIPKLQPFSTKIYIEKALNIFNKLIIERGKPDVIHSHISYPAGYIGLVLSEKYNIPLVVTEHASYFSNKLMKGFYRKYTKQVLGKAHKFTTVSSTLKKEIIQSGRFDCDVIPNFINFDKFTFNVGIKRNNDQFCYTNIGAMRYVKGIDILLKAFKILIFDYGYSKVTLNLVGGGKLIKEYKKLAENLGIIGSCNFFGTVSYDKIPQILQNSNALVISSRYETFCIAGLEGLASGLPVVSTDCGGTKEYLNERNGVIIDENTPENLARGMLKIMTGKNSFNPNEIVENIKMKFSAEVVCNRIIRLYEDVIKAHKVKNGEL